MLRFNRTSFTVFRTVIYSIMLVHIASHYTINFILTRLLKKENSPFLTRGYHHFQPFSVDKNI